MPFAPSLFSWFLVLLAYRPEAICDMACAMKCCVHSGMSCIKSPGGDSSLGTRGPWEAKGICGTISAMVAVEHPKGSPCSFPTSLPDRGGIKKFPFPSWNVGGRRRRRSRLPPIGRPGPRGRWDDTVCCNGQLSLIPGYSILLGLLPALFVPLHCLDWCALPFLLLALAFLGGLHYSGC